MLLVEITNSSEMVASKTHKLFAKMTPEKIDKNIVEAQVIKQMSDDLAEEVNITGLLNRQVIFTSFAFY